ncbi:MAG: Methyltransferase type 11 [Pedosphaera sp.]|nr:Methyltransferase type 11 [Pedosphaera sp.]
MASKSNGSAPGLKQKVNKLFHPVHDLDRRIDTKFQAINTQFQAVNERVDDLSVQINQIVSLLGLKYQLPAIPPKHLQVRVAGGYRAAFFELGKSMFQDLEGLLQNHGLSMFQFNRMLDFGCGCGRFLIPMSHRMDPKKLSGTDIDAEAIQWLRANYPIFDDLDVNDCAPPTKYPDGTFDFVFSVSIFTHLPEEMQHAWLKELARIMAPGGYGIFTTHGEKHYPHLSAPARGQLLEKGFYYHVGGKTEGLPDFYQTSFHTHDYIRREWGRYFEIVALQKRGLADHQDTVLVKKR